MKKKRRRLPPKPRAPKRAPKQSFDEPVTTRKWTPPPWDHYFNIEKTGEEIHLMRLKILGRRFYYECDKRRRYIEELAGCEMRYVGIGPYGIEVYAEKDWIKSRYGKIILCISDMELGMLDGMKIPPKPERKFVAKQGYTTLYILCEEYDARKHGKRKARKTPPRRDEREPSFAGPSWEFDNPLA